MEGLAPNEHDTAISVKKTISRGDVNIQGKAPCGEMEQDILANADDGYDEEILVIDDGNENFLKKQESLAEEILAEYEIDRFNRELKKRE